MKKQKFDIYNKLEGIKDYLCVIGDNRIRSEITGRIQEIIDIISTDFEYRKCEECGEEFIVTHEKQKFCPTKPGRKRSTCENTYNQRIKRHRLKEKLEIKKQE